jgi:glutaminyl-peptide cyclotransferase
MKNYLVIFLAIFIFNCTKSTKTTEAEATTEVEAVPVIPTINYAVKAYYPHDNSLYTEGFLVHDGKLFESSGGTRSDVGISDLTTGKFDKKVELNKDVYFGEGIIIFKNKLYQLTYTNQLGFIYDPKTYKQIGKFTYTNKEGWGLTADNTSIIMSDGTDKLTFMNAEMKPLKTVAVTENGIAKTNINELEYINGYIYANVYTENIIVKIDPQTGNIIGKIDLSSLAYEAKNKNPNADVLNGIAFDATKNKIYVTGKYWNNIYEIDFTH